MDTLLLLCAQIASALAVATVTGMVVVIVLALIMTAASGVAAMMARSAEPSDAKRRLRFAGGILAALVLFVATVLVFPEPFVRAAMPSVDEGAQVSVDFDDVSLNPFELSVRVRDLRVEGAPAGADLDLRIEEIFVDVNGLDSLADETLSIRKIEVSGVEGDIAYEARPAAKGDEEEGSGESRAKTEPRKFAIGSIEFRAFDVDAVVKADGWSLEGPMTIDRFEGRDLRNPGLATAVVLGLHGSGELFGAPFSAEVRPTDDGGRRTRWQIEDIAAPFLGPLAGVDPVPLRVDLGVTFHTLPAMMSDSPTVPEWVEMDGTLRPDVSKLPGPLAGRLSERLGSVDIAHRIDDPVTLTVLFVDRSDHESFMWALFSAYMQRKARSEQ